jgi:hypothetical protein
MKRIVLAVGVISTLLGGLWVLQGLGAVHIRPVLCFADCAPVQDPSAAWAIVGFLMIVVGAFGIFFSLKRPAARSSSQVPR